MTSKQQGKFSQKQSGSTNLILQVMSGLLELEYSGVKIYDLNMKISNKSQAWWFRPEILLSWANVLVHCKDLYLDGLIKC